MKPDLKLDVTSLYSYLVLKIDEKPDKMNAIMLLGSDSDKHVLRLAIYNYNNFKYSANKDIYQEFKVGTYVVIFEP